MSRSTLPRKAIIQIQKDHKKLEQKAYVARNKQLDTQTKVAKRVKIH